MLFTFIDSGKSSNEPCFRKRVEKPAYGPNSNALFPSIILVSRWGTDIGGAPTDAFPYTFALCCSIISGFTHFSHCPLTGKPPKPFPSGISAFSSKGKEPPPAPINTNFAFITLF
ncbi:hypothetical protein D3C86_1731920 [compost metagenome]